MAGGANASESTLSCKKCKSKVVNAIKCAKCGNAYHQSCAKLVTNIQFLDNSSALCCGPVPMGEDDTAFFEAVDHLIGPDKKMDFSIFTYLMKQKDQTINELREHVRLLNEHIVLLKANSNAKPDTPYIRNHKISSEPDKKLSPEKAIKKNINVQKTPSSNSVIDTHDININNQKPKEDRTNKRKPLIIGNGTDPGGNNNDGFAIARVVKRSSIHLTRINPKITDEQISNFIENNLVSLSLLKENISPGIKVAKLQSRHPDTYSSFKITMDSLYFKDLLEPNFWPKGVAVRKFFNEYTRRLSSTQKLPKNSEEDSRN